jgi:hypothetical protein
VLTDRIVERHSLKKSRLSIVKPGVATPADDCVTSGRSIVPISGSIDVELWLFSIFVTPALGVTLRSTASTRLQGCCAQRAPGQIHDVCLREVGEVGKLQGGESGSFR